jgi:galactose mutarotase-like enzyme
MSAASRDGLDAVRTAPAPGSSGFQYELRHGDHAAVITEIGATLRELNLAGSSVIDGFAAGEPSSAGRGQILAPWPNRLQDGMYSFMGREGRVELDEPEERNAIHGLVRWMAWTPEIVSRDAIVLRCELRRQPAYPWDVDLRVTYSLSDAGLRVATAVTNRSPDPAPFGLGFHPYLTVGTDTVDDMVLTIPARKRLVTDDRALPTGREDVSGTRLDFRESRPVGAAQLDTSFTDLRRDSAGRAVVRVARPDGEVAVALWMDEGFRYVQAYTGDAVLPERRRRRGIAIEPMTCPANALRTGTDLIRLEAGGTWRADWGITL